METNLSLSTFVLGEIILVLCIALLFSLRYNLKQKALLKRLLEKYREVKEDQKQAVSDKASFYENKKTERQRTILEYLELSISDSIQRYEKDAASHIPRLDSNHSFTARVAALRYLYLMAEKEVFDERGVTHAGWGLFEKKLADIVRWQDKKETQRQETKSNRLRLMQERLDALKGVNEKNSQLQEKIDRLLRSEEKLKQYHLDSQRTINGLKDMLEQLKQLSTNETSSGERLYAINQLDRDERDSPTTKTNSAIEIMRELQAYKSEFPGDIKEKINSYMNVLEVELIKSDQHIGTLKKELQAAKMQITNYALMLRDARNGEKYDSSIGSIHPVMIEVPSPTDLRDIPAEIKQLRENNRMQRDLIVKMEYEIVLLKNSASSFDTDEIRQEKEKEILRLERMVKECQGCIDTLESEVDHLYSQLQQRQVGPSNEVNETDSNNASDEFSLITDELEKTFANYQHLHAINRLILELIRCETFASIVEQMTQFVSDFNAPVGFLIQSDMGEAEHFPPHLFNESIIALTKSSTSTNSLIHIEEGTLFVFNKIHLLQLNTSVRSSLPILETSMQGLVIAVDECIKNLEAQKSGKNHAKETNLWVETIKNSLANIDIQYASQADENRKTFNNFISEMRRAYPLLNLQGQGAIVLDNAINEYEERMYLLLSSSDVIDREISKLIEHMKS